METFYQQPRSPRSPRAFLQQSSYLQYFLYVLGLVGIITPFAIDYTTEPFELSPLACKIPGSYFILSLQRCDPLYIYKFKPGSVHLEDLKPLPRIQTGKKVVLANPADEGLPEEYRVVKDGLKLKAHLQDLEAHLTNNLDLATLVARGQGAVRRLLSPLMFSKRLSQERISQLKKIHDNLLTNHALQSFLDFQSATVKLARSFTEHSTIIARVLDKWGAAYEKTWFKSMGTALKREEGFKNILLQILVLDTMEMLYEAILHANKTTAYFGDLKGVLNEVAHLNQTPLSSEDLGKLNEKKYWKKMLLPFKYESSMNGFNDIIEDLSSYYSDI